MLEPISICTTFFDDGRSPFKIDEIEWLDEEFCKAMDRIAELEKALAECRGKPCSSNPDEAGHEAKIELLRNKLRQLEKELAEKERECEQWKKEYKDVTDYRDELAKKLAEAAAFISPQKLAMIEWKHQDECKRLNADIDSYRCQRNELEKALAKMTRRYEHVHNQNVAAVQRVAEVEEKRDELAARYSKLKVAYQCFADRDDERAAKLTNCQQDAECFRMIEKTPLSVWYDKERRMWYAGIVGNHWTVKTHDIRETILAAAGEEAKP
jgi:chromosome segregation ATPase